MTKKKAAKKAPGPSTEPQCPEPPQSSVAAQLMGDPVKEMTGKEWFVANGYAEEMWASIPKVIKSRFASANKVIAKSMGDLEEKIKAQQAKLDKLLAVRNGAEAARADRATCVQFFDHEKAVWFKFITSKPRVSVAGPVP